MDRTNADIAEGNHGDNSSEMNLAAMSHVPYQAPPFWKPNPEAWFVQLEATFNCSQVHSDFQRYNTVICSLDSETVADMMDVIRTLPSAGKYQHIKERIIARYGDTVQKRLHTLFTGLELGTRTPAQLLRHMRSLAGQSVDEEALRVRWLDLMPVSVAKMLRLLRKSSLDELAEVADSIVESGPENFAVHRSRTERTLSPSKPSADNAVFSELSALHATVTKMAATTTQTIEALQNLTSAIRNGCDGKCTRLQRDDFGRHNNPSSRTGSRARTPTSPARTPTSAARTPSLCTYHERFGNRAKNCIRPCSHPKALRKSPKSLGKPSGVLAVSSGPHQAETRLHVLDRTTNTRFLVDSGSVLSLIPRSSVRDRSLPVQDLRLVAANGTPVRTFGRKILTLNLGLRRAIPWPFIVADVPSAILGADFLHHTGFLIDLQRRRLIDPTTTLSTPAEMRAATIHGVSVVTDTDPGDTQGGYQRLLAEFSDLSQPQGDCATFSGEVVQHSIHTSAPPVHCRPRPLYGERLAAAKHTFNELLKRGIVRPGSGQWSSPLHLVPKPGGGFRCTGDYRKLNAITIPDRYSLPRIEDLLQDCRDCTLFSVIDLEKAYYQVQMAPQDICKTAVTTPFGLFEFCRLSLGLRNATQTFQRFMDSILRDLPFARAYIDDVIVMSNSHKEHLQHLRALFERLRQAHLTINIGKCIFGQKEVDFLGFTVTSQGYRPPAKKIDAIRNFPKPKSPKALRRFLGMLNFYRHCLPHAAQQQAPLHEMLKGICKGSRQILSWTPEADIAFETAKSSLTSASRATYLSPTAPLSLSTDASDIAIGAALEQRVKSCWRPVGFFSRKLTPTERRYSTYDRELLAVYEAVKHFSRILEGREFEVRTDHKPLVHAAANPSDKASPRQQRHLDYVLQFNARFRHVKGEDNVVADTLSRPCLTISMPSPLDPDTIAAAQDKDEELPRLLEAGTLALQQLRINGSTIFCNVFDKGIRPYLPTALRRTAFESVHRPAHPSVRATVRMLTDKYVWPGVRKDCNSWARACDSCQRSKVQRHNREALSSFAVPDSRFDHVHLDIIKMPLVGNVRYCLTMIDRFSRWPVVVPLADIRAETIAKSFFEHWIAHYGAPISITSDQGTQFESALFASLAQMIGSQRIHTTPYHPQANGLIERFHRTLKAALMCESHIPWPERLPAAMLGLRSCIKEDLQASPAEMLYGRTLRVPGDFFVPDTRPADQGTFAGRLRDLFKLLKPVPTSNHSRTRPFKIKDLKTCSHVYRRVDTVRRPLVPPYAGPFKVCRRVNEKVYVILIDGEEKVVSADSLIPAYQETIETDTAAASSPVDRRSKEQRRDKTPRSTSRVSKRKRVTFATP